MWLGRIGRHTVAKSPPSAVLPGASLGVDGVGVVVVRPKPRIILMPESLLMGFRELPRLRIDSSGLTLADGGVELSGVAFSLLSSANRTFFELLVLRPLRILSVL